MIIDWRSRRYRGGSRWVSAGVIATYVGVTTVSLEVIEGDLVTTAGAYFRRTVTMQAGIYRRTATGEAAVFRRTVTSTDTER